MCLVTNWTFISSWHSIGILQVWTCLRCLIRGRAARQVKLMVWDPYWDHKAALISIKITLWHPYKTHTTPESVLALSSVFYQIWHSCWPGLMRGRAESQSSWCETLVGTTRQLRHASITHWHPYKTHTTPKSVLAFMIGVGSNLTLLMAWFDDRKGLKLK